MFEQKGYDAYNLHKADRAGESGVDLECTRKGETEKLLIAVKKHPSSKDVDQLKMFAQHNGTKIYVYTQAPTTRFSSEMKKLQNRVSFWNSAKFSSEMFSACPKLYVFLVIQNIFEQDMLDITMNFCEIYFDLDKKRREPQVPVKAEPAMLNLLWNAKDRSASLNKSLNSLQTIFEKSDLSAIDEKTKESITNAYFAAIASLDRSSLRPLKRAFEEFISKYQGNFDSFCTQTSHASNWIFFLQNLPELAPGHVVRTFEKARVEYNEVKDFLEKIKATTKTEPEENIGEILGDISRILSVGAYWLEDTVDDLFSIGLFGKWDSVRYEFPKDKSISDFDD